MSHWVADTSVVVKWFLDEPGSDAARRLQAENVEVSAPNFLLVEVANVLWKHCRKGKLEAPTGLRILAVLEEAPIRWHKDSELLQSAYRLGLEVGRTVYDCLYLTLARWVDCPLVTADRKFYDAIKLTPYSSDITWIDEIR